jgi:hypothetical protein
MPRLFLAAPAFLLCLALAGCVTNPTQELTLQQVCLAHYEHDPAGRETCMQSAQNRDAKVPDVTPQQLPLRTGQPSD